MAALIALSFIACTGDESDGDDPGITQPCAAEPCDPNVTDPNPVITDPLPASKMHRMGFVFLQTLTTTTHVSNIDFPRYTVLTLFSLVPKADGSLTTTFFDQRTEEVSLLKSSAAANNVALWVSIGGAGLSDGFEGIIGNAPAEQNFINNILAFIALHGFTGVDLDWEYPKTQAQSDAFAVFLANLKAALPASVSLSIDAPTFVHTYLNHGASIPPRDVYTTAHFNAIDYFNIMAYDMDVTEGEVARYTATEATVNWWRDRGLDMSKALLGVPFYGRDWSSGKKADMTWAYYEGWRDLNPTLIDKVYFTSEADRIKKVDLMINNDMAGVMYWEVTHDVKFNKANALATFWDEQLKLRGK